MTESVTREDEPTGEASPTRARPDEPLRELNMDPGQADILLGNLLASAADHIWFKDRDSRFMLVSDYLAEQLGYHNGSEIVGMSDHDLFVPELADEYRAIERRVMETRRPYSAVERVVANDGSVTWVSTKKMPLIDRDGHVIGIFGIARDVTKQIEAERVLARQAEELKALALRDELTGLHNRRSFFALGELQLKSARRERRPFAVVFIDLDGFKEINDTLGHHEGDRALADTAEILQATFRDSDIVARFGGDEFCVLLEGRESDARAAVRRLLAAVEARSETEQRPYRIELSVGVALFDPETPCSLEELVREADQQMYEDKRARNAAGRVAATSDGADLSA